MRTIIFLFLIANLVVGAQAHAMDDKLPSSEQTDLSNLGAIGEAVREPASYAPASAPADVSGWGFDIGFGLGPYMEAPIRFAAASPYFIKAGYANYRLVLNSSILTLKPVSGATIPDRPIFDIDLSFQWDYPLYKELTYTYARLGLGARLMDEDLYDGTILILPIAIGLNLVTMANEIATLSWFLEVNTPYPLNYDRKKSLPQLPNLALDEDVQFLTNWFTGIRVTF